MTPLLLRLLVGASLCAAVGAEPVRAADPAAEPRPPIPVRFTLPKPGFVTLVVEDGQGRRVRNLVGETPFPAGDHVVWWDGTDESGGVTEDPDGVFRARGKLVEPGTYRARGLVHDGIDLRYEFSVYTEGTPPWRTSDNTGRWLADHTPPRDVLCLPGPTPDATRVLIGSYVAEAGDGLVWADLDGRKRAGVRWVGGNWTGASQLARDVGPRALPGVAAYAASSWVAGQNSDTTAPGELRVTALSDGPRTKDRAVLAHRFDRKGLDRSAGGPVGISNPADKCFVGGLAAHNGVLVLALPRHGQLMFVNARDGDILGTVAVESVGDLAFDRQGRLLMLSGRRLVRYALPDRIAAAAKPDGLIALPSPQVVVSDGLTDPSRVMIDDRGHIYVSDRGTSHQVKVFSPDGEFVRAVGTPGGVRVGPYDPTRMHNPCGMTITPDGRLWVAEESFTPKRVSVWAADGTFVRAMYGPGQYGAGGSLDPDKKRFYYHDHGGLQFALDWQKGTWTLDAIYDLPGFRTVTLPGGGPQTPVYLGGRQYTTNAFNSSPTNGPKALGLWRMTDGRAVPVAAVGDAYEWDVLRGEPLRGFWPKGISLDRAGQSRDYQLKNNVLFAWSDRNEDGRVQPDEVTFRRVTTPKVGEMSLAPDLTVTTSFTVRLTPEGFTGQGVPLYDAAAAVEEVPDIRHGWSSGARVAIAAADGRTVLTGNPLRGYKDGKLTWTYPNAWPSLHEGHRAPPQQYPGQLIATTRVLGMPIAVPGSDAGEIWGYNGDPGQQYLLTTDGLFVSMLFRNAHKSSPPKWDALPQKRGMRLNDVSKHGEDFWTTLGQAADGKVYLVAGKDHSSIVRLDGLETIRRLPAREVPVTPRLLAQCGDYFQDRDSRRQENKGRDTLTVHLRKSEPIVDGKLDDWVGAEWVSLDAATTAAVAVAGDRLFAAFRTQDKDLLANTGESLPMLFKTGGALDLMIGTNPQADPKRSGPVAGDVRLLIARSGGKPMAALYRPVSPGAGEPVSFSSPWRTVTMDRVDDVSNLVRLASGSRTEDIRADDKVERKTWDEYEISVPLSALGLTPRPAQAIAGDIGILRGQKGETSERLYWHNKSTGLVNDVPGEAMLTPRLWGRWQFEVPIR